MAWTSKALFIGSHFWFAPIGAAFTSPNAGVISQNGTWPDAGEVNWASWAIGICETCDLDPKAATSEIILAPSPGSAVALDEISPYAVPEISFTTKYVDSLAVQLALNTQQLWATATTQFNPNGGGQPGIRGILKAQHYGQDNTLLLNYQSWVYLKLKSALKADMKTMTKPEYTATLLFSQNNIGSV